MRSKSRILVCFLVLFLSFLCAPDSEGAMNGVSGAAYLYPENSIYRAKISIDISQDGGNAPGGTLQYYYTRTRLNFVSTGITSLSISGNEAIITGAGSVNGVGGYTYTATVADGSPDIFGITIRTSQGTLCHAAGPKEIAGGDLIVRGNQAPVSDAGPDQTVRVTKTVTLDGSKSSDVDGDALTYRWSFSALPSGSAAVLSDQTAVKPTFVADKPGNYELQLVVNDGTMDSAPDAVTISTENSEPVADSGPDQTVVVTQTVTLDGSKSSDVDGNLLTYKWSFAALPPGSAAALSDPAAVNPTFVVDKPGAYVLQLIVNDGSLESLPDSLTISTGNSKPVADAGPDQTVFVNNTLSLDGSRSMDADGDPLAFLWSFTASPPNSIAVLSDPTAAKPTFAAEKPGTYVLQLIVNDGKEDSLPDTVTISTENSKPVAEAGPDQTVNVGDVVNLSGSNSSDADSDPLTYRWSFTTIPPGSSAALSDPSSTLPSFTPDQEGIYIVQLIVNDGKVDSDPDTVTITASFKMVPVPNVVTMTQEGAQAAILTAALTVGAVTSDYSDTMPVGSVISQNPPEGTLVQSGTPVSLVVSLGPPSPTTHPPEIVSTPPAVSYTAIDYPGAPQTGAFGINDGGTIVGAYYGDTGTPIRGFSLRCGAYTPLDYPGASWTYPTDVNNGNTIVGYYDKDGYTHGFSLSWGTYTAIDYPGASYTTAYGINNAGTIVGRYKDVNGVPHGFSLSEGTYTTIDYPSASDTLVWDINDQGTIVGRYHDWKGIHGYSLSEGTHTSLDYPGTSYYATMAHGINNGGTIVGAHSHTGSYPYHGFSLSEGTYTSLEYPGVPNTFAQSINNGGTIVGYYEYNDGSGRHGFLATPGSFRIGQFYSYDVDATDPDGDPLTYSLTTHPANMTIDQATGLIQWSPRVDQVGSHQTTVRVTDTGGLFAEQSFTLIVKSALPLANAGQDQTVLTTDTVTLDGSISSDEDCDPLTYRWSFTSVAPDSAAILSDSAAVKPTVVADMPGTYVLQLIVNDGKVDSAPDTVTITANSKMVPVPNVVAMPQAAAQAAILSATLTVGPVTSDYSNTIPLGNVVSQNPGAGASVATGSAVSLLVSLGSSGSSSKPPVIASMPIIAGTEGTLYTYDVEATDPEGEPLTYSLTVNPAGMTIDAASGLIQWSPILAQVGSHNVTVRVSDQGGLFAEQSFGITVAIANRGPVAVDDVFKMNPGQPITIGAPGILANDSDPDGNALTAGTVKQPSSGTMALNPDGSFTYTPKPATPVASLNVRIKWSWTSSTVLPDSLNVMMTPGIIDLNGDGMPDVVFSSNSSRAVAPMPGVLRALDGTSGAELFTVSDPTLQVNPDSNVAVGDLDSDGKPEIIACAADGNQLLAFNHDGSLQWRSANLEPIVWSAPSLSDLDGDGKPEIIIGRQVLNGDGTLRWTGSGGYGSPLVRTEKPGGYAASLVADIDLDGLPEIIAGNTVYRADGVIKWQAPIPDGFAAVGNFDSDPYGEIVLTAQGMVRLLEHDGAIKWGPLAIPGGGFGGPPTVADFDGDGQPEIGVAGATRYVVVETDGSIKWQAVTQDGSSNMTGSSVFDFEGDGAAEVLYRDELKLRFYRGTDGMVLWETPLSSCTTLEYPVAVDVDGDGHAEVIASASNDCGYGPQRGIYVFADAGPGWTPTRKIWNQHSYHITNINEDGTIPRHEDINWLFPNLNNFRLNAFAPADTAVADSFTYRASDGSLSSNEATVQLVLEKANHAPVFTSAAFQSANTGQSYTYDANAIDPDAGNTLTFSLTTAPSGMAIDAQTGMITWTPTTSQAGNHDVTVRVTDQSGLFAEYSFTITAVTTQPANQAPTIIAAGFTPQWTQLAPTGQAPSPRAYAGVNAYDAINDRLLLFGGSENDAVLPHLNDVWVLENATGAKGTPNWLKLTPTGGPPAKRVYHSASYDPTANRLIVYGGGGGNLGPVFSDVWVLTNANGLGGVPEWIQLPSGEALGGHAASYDAVSNRLIVFGGMTPANSDASIVRVLIDANGIGSTQWITLTTAGTAPPPRGHISSAVYDPLSNRLLVFGGRTTQQVHFNDVWILTNANGLGGTPTWAQLTPDGTPASPRGMHSIAYDANSNRLIVFGGMYATTDTYQFYDEAWVLTNANGIGGMPRWQKLGVAGAMPPARGYHSMGYAGSENRMVVTAGRNDNFPAPHFFNDVWVLANASGLCTAGQPCTFQAMATDSDVGDVLTYSLDAAPVGMAIDSATGAITWTPAITQIGDQTVTVRVTDRGGLFATQSFSASVSPVAVPNVVGLAPEWAESFITAGDLAKGAKTSQGGAITLNFDSLPSRQGWSYWVSGPGVPTEDRLFRTNGGVLFQDTLGIGGRAAGYELLNGVDPRLPLSIAVRARVTAEQAGSSANHAGFGFVAWAGSSLTGNNFFLVGLGSDAIQLPTSKSDMAAFDCTEFHDYLLQAQPGVGTQLTVDGNELWKGSPRVYPFIPYYDLYLGDVTEGPNARAEVTAYSFTQPRVVGQNPLPGTQVPNKTAVDLTIVEGPATETVPRLTGLTQDQTSAALTAANLVVGAITSAPSGTVPAGQVSDQSPLPGIHVPKSTPVNILLSTGPPPGNQPPTITSSAILNGAAGQAYAYQVIASDPNAGDTLTYSLTSAPAGMTIDAATGTISWTSTLVQVGSYPVTVRVTDPWGLFDEKTYTLTVTTNTVPVANAGPDQTVLATQTVTLDGSKSSDADSDPLTFQWSFSARPNGSAATLSDPAAVNPTFVADKPGTYELQLIVNDGKADSLPDVVTISTENSKPVADAGTDQTVTVTQAVTLDGTKSSDVDGDPLTYLWSFTTTPSGSVATLSDPTAVKPTFVADKPGVYELQLVVNDSKVDSLPDSVTINTENSKPVANAGPDQTVTVTQTVTLDGTKSSDVDGDSVTYLWSFTTVPPGSSAVLTNPIAEKPTFVVDKPGTYVLQLIVNDGKLDSLPDSVTINTENSKPVANAGPDQTGYAGDAVNLDGNGSKDVDGDPLTYRWSFTSRPSGSNAVLSNPGIVNPQFTADLEGTYVVQLIVNDGTADSEPDTATITVSVKMVDVPNVVGKTQSAAETAILAADLKVGSVTSSYSSTVPAGSVIGQSPAAGTSVARGSAVDLVVSLGPEPVPTTVNVPNVVGMAQAAAETTLTAAGLTLGTVAAEQNSTVPAGSVIRQAPAEGTLVPKGSAVNLVVSSGSPVAQLVSVLVTPASPTITTSGSQQFTAIGILDNGSSQVLTTSAAWSSSNPAVAFVSATPGLIGSATVGTVTISASYGGKAGSAVITVVQRTPNTTPPTAEITSPVNQDAIITPVSVTGTATDPEFLKYIVEIAPVGEAAYTVIAESTTPVTNGTLGTLDPTLLVNGLYNLRLRVIDRGGIIVTTSPIQVQVKRELKVGNFTLAFQDSNIPYACLPVTVTRVYDSRDKKAGDFGVGWRLDLQTMKLNETGTMGAGWAIDAVNKPGPFGIPILTYVLYDTAPHMVSLTLPDGQVEEFDLKPSPSESKLNPIGTVTLAFSPRPGTLGTLTPVVGSTSYQPSSNTGNMQLIDSDATVLDPQQYRYTSKDGSVYLIDKTAGVQKVQCSNGMAITVTPSGISHDSGGGVAFSRDGLGRITSLTDPNGRTQTYAYDANGDLASHTDAVGNATKFLYNYSHGLIEIRDPRGVAAIRNEYDSEGRLISSTDPLGKKSTFDHDLVARTETVTDRLGQITVHEYDASGNIIRTTDPLGGVTTRAYDAYGNELTRTDPLGRTTISEYDSRRNVTKETDALGNSTGYTYNALNQVTQVTDPLGRVNTNTYDASGNLTQSRDALGNVTTYTYDSGGIVLPGSGNLLSKTDAMGNVTRYEYDTLGRLTKETDPLGLVNTSTYDANGNRLTQTTTRDVNGTTETLTTNFEYDANNRLTKTTHPDGSITRTEYNTIGKQAKTIDALGRQTSYEYDALGRLARTTYPDGSTETSTYDAEGRRITSTDRAGRSTTYAYDALGRLTGTTYADGTGTATTYDAAGQVVASTDGRGNITNYEYDGAGRRAKVTDATGAVTSFAYDAAGNQTQVTDANGNTVALTYDTGNRRTQTTYADSTFDSVAYDALGRQVSKTDQAGKTTRFGYDALGRLLQVTDALGQITRYGYDELGNQISQTDALGRVTDFAYDRMGRRTSRTLPLGMREEMTYDAAGNLVSKTDFNGKTTTYAYDSVNRLLSRTPDPSFGQPAVRFTYTASGQRSTMQDNSGTTTYSYDNRDRLAAKATPQGTLSYTYDAAGNLASITSNNTGGAQMSYTYDARNRLASVTDRKGATTYSYNSVGNLAGFLYPNGVQTTYTYNALNRLTNVTGVKGGTLASYAYTLGPAGNRTSVTEASGRKAEYTYDALYRLTGEAISGDTAGKNGAIGYTYDAVGNRLARTSTLAEIPAQSFSYDANDRITSERYADNGNTLVSGTQAYKWDFENKLASVNFGATWFVYDGDGNRVAKTVDGVTTKFLVDDRNPTGYAQVLEEISGGTVQKTYTYGLKLINQQQASGISYYGFDGHGSVRYLTDAAGVVTDTYDYDAFGNLVRQTGTTLNVYLHAGEQNDINLGHYYLRARYLNHQFAKFLTHDSWEGDPFDPRTLSKYGYVRQNPINMVDPSGNIAIAFAMPSLLADALLQGYRTAREATKLFLFRERFNIAVVAFSTAMAITYPKKTTGGIVIDPQINRNTGGRYPDVKIAMQMRAGNPVIGEPLIVTETKVTVSRPNVPTQGTFIFNHATGAFSYGLNVPIPLFPPPGVNSLASVKLVVETISKAPFQPQYGGGFEISVKLQFALEFLKQSFQTSTKPISLSPRMFDLDPLLNLLDGD